MGAKFSSGAATTASADADRVPRVADVVRSASGTLGSSGTRARPLERIEPIAWWACVAVLATWAVAYVAWPFSNDQGNLAWVGSTVLAGGMPYRDAWDVKGPAAHVLFALAELLFGRNEWGLRVFDLALVALGAVSLRRIVGRYASPWAARWAIAFYLLWYASLNHHNTAQPDGWAAVLLVVAVRMLLSREAGPSPTSAAVAGALIAVCALIKPTYALFVVLPFVAGTALWRGGNVGRALRTWTSAAIGFLVPVALCVGWFYVRGALDDWAAVHLDWIPSSYAQMDSAWLNRVQYLITFFTGGQFAPAMPFVIGGLEIVRRRSATAALVLLLWLAIGAGGVLIQGQFYPYHWHPVYPPLAALVGLGLNGIWTWIRRDVDVARGSAVRSGPAAHDGRGGTPIVAAVSAALGAVVLAGAAIGPVLHDYRFAKSFVSAGGAADYDRVEFGPFGHHGGVFPELVDYLRAHSGPADAVLVWGSAAGVNYLSARGAVAPFGFIQPLVDPPDTNVRRRYREQFLARLTSTPPRYVVALDETLCSRTPSTAERQLMGKAEGLIRCLADLPTVRAFVGERYVMDVTMGPLEVWRRR